MKNIEIKSYSNKSYSYYSERSNMYVNIPSELAKAILELQKELNKPNPDTIEMHKSFEDNLDQLK